MAHANKLSSKIAPATEVNGIVRGDALPVDGAAAPEQWPLNNSQNTQQYKAQACGMTIDQISAYQLHEEWH